MKIGSIILPITMAFVLVQSKVYRFRQTKAGDLVSEPSENRPIYVNPTLDLQPAATHHDGIKFIAFWYYIVKHIIIFSQGITEESK